MTEPGAWLRGVRRGLLWLLMGGFLFSGAVGLATVPAQADEKGEIIEGFIAHQSQEHGVKAISDHRRHQILFAMGALLFIGILTTAGLGIAMGIFGKEVFLAHMISAGLTVFLAAAHAVASMVWFFPF
jgi:hypothetical protein